MGTEGKMSVIDELDGVGKFDKVATDSVIANGSGSNSRLFLAGGGLLDSGGDWGNSKISITALDCGGFNFLFLRPIA
jgi:hypothetical protein